LPFVSIRSAASRQDLLLNVTHLAIQRLGRAIRIGAIALAPAQKNGAFVGIG
jgi:hypothetical protein